MNLPRETAETLNPIIGNTSDDTLTNVIALVGLIQDITINNHELRLSKQATTGLFLVTECLQVALEYELADRSRNLVGPQKSHKQAAI